MKNTAAPSTEFQALVAWIESERPRDYRFTPKVPCRALFTMEKYEEVDEEELQRMKDLVARRNQPGDPLENRIIRQEWLLKSPYIEQREAFIRDPNNWRVNTELYWRVDGRLVRDGEFFSDIGRRDGWAFMYSPREIAVFDPKAGYPTARNVDSQWGLAADSFTSFSGGIPLAQGLQVNPSLSHLAYNGSFAVVLDKPDGTAEYVIRIEGVWDSAKRRGFTNQVATFQGDVGEGPPIHQLEISDWRYHAFLDTWLAHLVIEPIKSGTTIRLVRELLDIQPISQDDFESWTKVPSPIMPEPLRGTQAIQRVKDYRASLDGVSLPLDQEIPGRSVIAAITTTVSNKSIPMWTWGLLLAGVSIAIAIVAVRLRVGGHR